MKKSLLGMVFVLSLSVCPAQLLKIDFSVNPTSGMMITTSGIYQQSNAPANPWSFSWPYSGTFTYNTDSLQETFFNNDPYWKWQYQTQQTSLSVNKNGGTYDSTLDFPYGTVTTYTEYALVTGIDMGGQIITTPMYSEYFEVAFDDKSSHTGIVNSVILKFPYSDFIDHTSPYQPQTVFDPDNYAHVTSDRTTFPPILRINYRGYFIIQTASYSETGEMLGYYQRVSYDMDSLQATVIPEPATLLLLGLGGMILRRKK